MVAESSAMNLTPPVQGIRAGMPIRLRLALCFAAVCGMALLTSGLLSYAFYTRGHYDDLDRVLMKDAEHAATEFITVKGLPLLNGTVSDLEVALRLYRPDGVLREQSRDGYALPPVSPQMLLEKPSGPAFDLVSQLGPPAPSSGGGAFGLLEAGGQRWRSYIMPIRTGEPILGYVEALSPLGRLDALVARLRLLLTALGLICLIGALAISWLVAGRILKPIAEMTQAADEITRSRTLANRVAVPPYRDELERLARTFNDMLASLEQYSENQKRFVSDASHELRAPLTVIQGNLEFLRRHPDVPARERSQVLGDAEREAKRMTRLVAELLTLARGDAGVPILQTPVELEVVLLEAFHEAQHLAHGLLLELGGLESAQIEGNEDRIKQLLLILLDNALKYSQDGDTVRLSLRRSDGCAEIRVCDEGLGISELHLPHVFDRFYRADPARGRNDGGFGLGLPIARWIVESHGGEIWLESQVGVGTAAVVRLPLLQ